MKKSTSWTDQEDKLLLQLYDSVDCFQKWKYIAQKFLQRGFNKNEISCRERFINKLNPDLKKDKLTINQLRSVFEYYNQYGPLWSVFESLIPGRTQNLLKNKFYSTLRSLIRLIIGAVEKDLNRKVSINSTALPSKLLVQIYQGKKSFRKVKGYLLMILNKINFEVDMEKINHISKNQNNEIMVELIKEEINKSRECRSGKLNKKSAQEPSKSEIPRRKLKSKQKVQFRDDERNVPMKRQQKSKQIGPELQQIQQNQEQQYMGFYLPVMNPINFVVPVWRYFSDISPHSQ